MKKNAHGAFFQWLLDFVQKTMPTLSALQGVSKQKVCDIYKTLPVKAVVFLLISDQTYSLMDWS